MKTGSNTSRAPMANHPHILFFLISSYVWYSFKNLSFPSFLNFVSCRKNTQGFAFTIRFLKLSIFDERPAQFTPIRQTFCSLFFLFLFKPLLFFLVFDIDVSSDALVPSEVLEIPELSEYLVSSEATLGLKKAAMDALKSNFDFHID